jgi:hypothetical protein
MALFAVLATDKTAHSEAHERLLVVDPDSREDVDCFLADEACGGDELFASLLLRCLPSPSPAGNGAVPH